MVGGRARRAAALNARNCQGGSGPLHWRGQSYRSNFACRSEWNVQRFSNRTKTLSIGEELQNHKEFGRGRAVLVRNGSYTMSFDMGVQFINMVKNFIANPAKPSSLLRFVGILGRFKEVEVIFCIVMMAS
jgi:hypothetical protein